MHIGRDVFPNNTLGNSIKFQNDPPLPTPPAETRTSSTVRWEEAAGVPPLPAREPGSNIFSQLYVASFMKIDQV